MRLILTGDLHLGRSSSRISDSLNPGLLRSVSAWSRIVDLAIQKNAQIVCLSGDITDQANKFWESVGPLKEGINRLAANGILTVAVAGNHDFDVLPQLADQLSSEHFKLLGRNGKWERLEVRLTNGEALNINGWSFPDKNVSVSPLESYNLNHDPSIPTIGLIHGDLNAVSSNYAPLALSSLQALSGNWLLGHIHAPDLITGSSWILYPGSPQALDPGEPGAHGPWVVEIENGNFNQPIQYPISTVWYETLTIDISLVQEAVDLPKIIIEKTEEKVKLILKKGGPFLKHISLRLNLTGNTKIVSQVNEITDELVSDFHLLIDSVHVSINKIENNTLPETNLKELAQTGTAVAVVAELLLELEKSEISEKYAELIQHTVKQLEQLDKPGYYRIPNSKIASKENAVKYLSQSGRALLTELTGQRNEK